MVDVLMEASQVMAFGWAFGRGTMAHEEWRIVVGVRIAVVGWSIVGLIEPLVRIAAFARTTSPIERAQT
jgi:hypothetical protein